MTVTLPPESQGLRLSKCVMQLAHCSRSQAEQYIAGGWVQVDAKVVEDPAYRVHSQAVRLDPAATLLQATSVSLLLNKPSAHAFSNSALLTMNTHWSGDDSPVRPLQRHFQALQACVPLEQGATGLVVFSQDWRILRKLQEDANVIEHELIADVAGQPDAETIQDITAFLKNPRNALPPTQCSLSSSKPERSQLRFAIKGAHPGLIAHICAAVGLDLLALRRIRIGRVALRELPLGQWRYLANEERF